MAGCSEIDFDCSPPSLSIPSQYNATSDFIDRHLNTAVADKIAVIDDNDQYSYRELSERVNRAGNCLLSLGLGLEDRVALALLDTIDFPSLFWGAIKAGIVPVPLNTLLTADDYTYILNDSRATVLVVSVELLEVFEPIIPQLLF